jgi:hypothetical protein
MMYPFYQEPMGEWILLSYAASILPRTDGDD